MLHLSVYFPAAVFTSSFPVLPNSFVSTRIITLSLRPLVRPDSCPSICMGAIPLRKGSLPPYGRRTIAALLCVSHPDRTPSPCSGPRRRQRPQSRHTYLFVPKRGVLRGSSDGGEGRGRKKRKRKNIAATTTTKTATAATTEYI